MSEARKIPPVSGVGLFARNEEDALAYREWEEWQQLNQMLHETGAVTAEDGAALEADRSTPGRRLYAAIRSWGEARARLALYHGKP